MCSMQQQWALMLHAVMYSLLTAAGMVNGPAPCPQSSLMLTHMNPNCCDGPCWSAWRAYYTALSKRVTHTCYPPHPEMCTVDQWRAPAVLAGLTSLDISADSTVAITGSEDMTARISNIHTGKILGTFSGGLQPCHFTSCACCMLEHDNAAAAAAAAQCCVIDKHSAAQLTSLPEVLRQPGHSRQHGSCRGPQPSDYFAGTSESVLLLLPPHCHAAGCCTWLHADVIRQQLPIHDL